MQLQLKNSPTIPSQPKITSELETEKNNEIIGAEITKIIQNTDTILKKLEIESQLSYGEKITEETGNRVPGSRFLLCGLASEIVAYQINNNPELNKMNVYAKQIQNQDLHSLVRQQFQDIITEGEREEAFRHAITIIYKPPNDVDLVDLTICQYFDPESEFISEGDRKIPMKYNRISIADILIKEGKITISDPNLLFKYLLMTTHNRNSNFLQTLMQACMNTDLNKVQEIDKRSSVGEKSIKKILDLQ